MNPSESAKFLQSSSQLLFVWALGGLIAFLGGLCFAELGGMFPRTGGQVVYLEEAFRPWAGFLFGWTLFSTIQTGALAAVSFTCARFVGRFFPMGDLAASVLAVSIVWLLSAVNYFGIKPGSIVQNVFTMLKILALLVIVGWGIFGFKAAAPRLGPLFPQGFDLRTLSLFGLALMPALFSYGGWQNLNFVAGEVRSPSRNIPTAVISGVLLVVAVYVLSNLVFVRALTLSEVSRSTKLASDAAEAMIGPAGGTFVSLAVIVSTFGITNVFILTGARVYTVMARSRAFFPFAARIHPRYGSPHYSILLQALWVTALLLTNTYGQLLQYVTFGDWIFFGLTALALLVLRRRRPDIPRPYRVWGYPVVPALFFLISAAVVVNVFISKPGKSAVGSLIILAGLPLYFYASRRGKKNGV